MTLITFHVDGLPKGQQSNHEEWRPIIGYDGIYEASSLGRVRSLDRIVKHRNRWGGINEQHRRGSVMRQQTKKNGYLSVQLGGGEFSITHLVHRLIAMAFVDSYQPSLTVNHINGDKTDNRPENLEWVTHRDNYRHAINAGLAPLGDRNGSRTKPHRRPRGESNTSAKLTNADVIQIRRLRSEGWSMPRLSKKFMVATSNIENIVKGRTWKHV